MNKLARFDLLVPDSRAQVTGLLSWLLWAIFGNDEDGKYGQRSGLWPSEHPTQDAATFWAWWQRNSFHNLTRHVLAWRREPARILLQWSARSGLRLWFLGRQAQWLEPEGELFGQFQVIAVPPLVSGRLGPVECYLGFREGGGLGAALRRNGAHPK